MDTYSEVREEKNSLGVRILNKVEQVGNKLPDPIMLFIVLAVVVIAVSWLAANMGASVVHPATGKELAIKSLLSAEGIVFMITKMLDNFTGFAPLGLVLSMMIGVGMAEKVGLLEAVVKRTILNAPRRLITASVVFAGIMMNIASDASMILLPPLAALVFLSVGRHPIAGLIAGFASAGAGFTTNLIIVGTDALLSGISTEAAKAVNPHMIVTPVDNWYFNIASVFVLTVVGVLVTEKIVEPRLGTYTGDKSYTKQALSGDESRALRNAGIAGLLYIVAIGTLVMWPGSPLQNAKGGLIPSPLVKPSKYTYL